MPAGDNDDDDHHIIRDDDDNEDHHQEETAPADTPPTPATLVGDLTPAPNLIPGTTTSPLGSPASTPMPNTSVNESAAPTDSTHTSSSGSAPVSLTSSSGSAPVFGPSQLLPPAAIVDTLAAPYLSECHAILGVHAVAFKLQQLNAAITAVKDLVSICNVKTAKTNIRLDTITKEHRATRADEATRRDVRDVTVNANAQTMATDIQAANKTLLQVTTVQASLTQSMTMLTANHGVLLTSLHDHMADTKMHLDRISYWAQSSNQRNWQAAIDFENTITSTPLDVHAAPARPAKVAVKIEPIEVKIEPIEVVDEEATSPQSPMFSDDEDVSISQALEAAPLGQANAVITAQATSAQDHRPPAAAADHDPTRLERQALRRQEQLALDNLSKSRIEQEAPWDKTHQGKARGGGRGGRGRGGTSSQHSHRTAGGSYPRRDNDRDSGKRKRSPSRSRDSKRSRSRDRR
jgi:hypothetical protein